MPVTKLESSLAKNSATLAMSAGWPSRFKGIRAAICSRSSGGMPAIMAVSVGPGLRTLTRIPRSASSAAQVRAKERRAALVAAYTGDTDADFADCVVELVFAAAGDVDVSAFGDEEFGCGQSHACGGSGDDCDLSMQFCHGRVFLCALIIGVPGCQPRLLSRSLVGAPTTAAGSRHRGLESGCGRSRRERTAEWRTNATYS